ncbi:transporter, major facilitator family protein [Mycobacterium bohemicum DSM 44277]|uniref:MFS transporter n=2 Tax=Mycobacterium bohemicum TaxID=56425 RepID=A0A1X1RAK4_MYCBE|nr:MFS transporter [Mycobacterium bohemicum]ORV02291.1 MFS transporter [Mycobacterium bohemicum]CPR12850.1 transporter, major facilitator family protein [Mycobacterium bohemicum DSM 44277]
MGSNGATGLAGRTELQARGRDGSNATLFAAVLFLLFAMGWAASHFVALMPAISDSQHMSPAMLDAIFGIYALGLLPGLVVGGRTSDAWGRRPVALTGAAAALVGTLAMVVSEHSFPLLVGRFVVGLGVGLAMSSGTAWASDLRGTPGAATAGAVLIAGFAVGPFIAGAVAGAGRPGVGLSFWIAAGLLVLAMGIAAVTPQDAGASAAARDPEHAAHARHGVGWALGWAMPLAPWVFASATLGFVTLPARMHTALSAPLAAGTATLLVNGVSGLVQVAARARAWGPQAGTVGAVLAALGYAASAAAPPTMSLAMGLPLLLVLGCASGLCLREGLIDLQTAAPPRVRGALVGAFYAVTYVGFALPLLLTVVGSPTVSALILLALAAVAAATAVGRAVRLRRNAHRGKPIGHRMPGP